MAGVSVSEDHIFRDLSNFENYGGSSWADSEASARTTPPVQSNSPLQAESSPMPSRPPSSSRRRPARESLTRGIIAIRNAKRRRSKNWTADEKRAFLQAKLEAERYAEKGKVWVYISQRLQKYSRSAKECENFWGTVRKSFRESGRHENRSEEYQLVRKILEEQEKKKKKRLSEEEEEKKRQAGPSDMVRFATEADQGPSHMEHSAADAVDGANQGQCHMVHSAAEANDGTQISMLPRVESHIANAVEDDVAFALDILRCAHDPANLQIQQLTAIELDVKQRIISEAIKHVRSLAASGYIFDVDDPIGGLGPYIKRYTKAALKATLKPLYSS